MIDYGAITLGAFTTILAAFTGWLKFDQGKTRERLDKEVEKKQDKEMCAVMHDAVTKQMNTIVAKLDEEARERNKWNEKYFETINDINIQLARMNGNKP